jgi:hypothetical protein
MQGKNERRRHTKCIFAVCYAVQLSNPLSALIIHGTDETVEQNTYVYLFCTGKQAYNPTKPNPMHRLLMFISVFW